MFPPQGRARQQTGRVLEVRGSENLIEVSGAWGPARKRSRQAAVSPRTLWLPQARDALLPRPARQARTPHGRGPGDLALTVRTPPPALIPDPRAADREPGTQRTFEVPYQMCSRGEPVLIPSSLSWY